MIHNTTILAPRPARDRTEIGKFSRIFAAGTVILLGKHAFSQDREQFFHGGVIDASK